MSLHRSLVFWLGFSVFAFLIWAWADSMRHVAWFRWFPPSCECRYHVENSGAKLKFLIGRPDPPFGM